MSNSTIIHLDFEGLEIPFYKKGDDYFINATVAAKHYNKQTTRFCNSKKTKEYIQSLNKLSKEPIEYIKIVEGGEFKGTWIHKKLIILYARYLSSDFAVWCDTQIEKLLSNNHLNYLYKPREQTIQEKLILLHSYTGNPVVQEWIVDKGWNDSARFDLVDICEHRIIELKKDIITVEKIVEKVITKRYLEYADTEFNHDKFKLVFLSPKGLTEDAKYFIKQMNWRVTYMEWNDYILQVMNKIKDKCGKQQWYFNSLQPQLLDMIDIKQLTLKNI